MCVVITREGYHNYMTLPSIKLRHFAPVNTTTNIYKRLRKYFLRKTIGRQAMATSSPRNRLHIKQFAALQPLGEWSEVIRVFRLTIFLLSQRTKINLLLRNKIFNTYKNNLPNQLKVHFDVKTSTWSHFHSKYTYVNVGKSIWIVPSVWNDGKQNENCLNQFTAYCRIVSNKLILKLSLTQKTYKKVQMGMFFW